MAKRNSPARRRAASHSRNNSGVAIHVHDENLVRVRGGGKVRFIISPFQIWSKSSAPSQNLHPVAVARNSFSCGTHLVRSILRIPAIMFLGDGKKRKSA